MGLLSLAIWTPIVFGVVLLALGRDEQAGAVRWIALIGAVSVSWSPCRCTAASNWARRDAVRRKEPWIERFNVNYHLGVDGISLLVRAAHRLHHRHRGHCRLGSDHRAREPVHGRLPDPVAA
jgi:NADH:ubiquinone oxidoreductase subunit 4 (subunit M)